MASRDIQDCEKVLQKCWSDASAAFIALNPEMPVPFITCTHRSPQEQLDLYAQGRTKKGAIVTYIARGGKHNAYPSKAFDIAFKTRDGKLDWSSHLFERFANIVKMQHHPVQWGGDWKSFKDLPHFQC